MTHATIISLEARKEARALTIPQLEAVGITPTVIISRPKGKYGNPAGNIAASKEALRSAPEGQGVLFMEDDIDIGENFLEAIELAKAMDEFVYLYTHEPQLSARGFERHVWRSIAACEKMLTHATNISGATHIHSTQCVWVPARHIPELLTVMNDKQSFDVQLRTYQKIRGHEAFAVLPAPVQHRNDRTARDKNQRMRPLESRVSLSYDYCRGNKS